MSSALDKRQAIGITAIWGEGQGVERVSVLALTVHCVRLALQNIRRASVTAALTVITIAVAISLLGIFLLFLQNASSAVSSGAAGGGELNVMVFLKDGVTQIELEGLSRQLGEIAGGKTVSYIDKGQALQLFRGALGDDAKILEGLDGDNPLPPSLQVRLDTVEESEAVYAKATKRFADALKVEGVRYSRGGVQQIRKMISLVRFLGGVGMVFLFVVAGFIIANTIKLALYNHRIEIEIMQLVGAQRPAIYAPYLLEGLVQGIAGAGVGLGAVFVVYLLVRSFVGGAEVLKVAIPSFEFIPGPYLIGVVFAGALVGFVGSFLAVRRFLSE